MKDHFTEILLCAMFLLVCIFIFAFGKVHNDSLAGKFTEFAGQVLGALFLAMRGVRSNGGSPPEPPKT